MSMAVTQGIKIEVSSMYLPERSHPDDDFFFFAYHVRISNQGDHIVQLMSRRWVITNSEGVTETVTGPGVVGEQPVLAPGEFFEYTSFCPLNTSVGTMHGSYRMQAKDGGSFEAEIAPFSLAIPNALN